MNSNSQDDSKGFWSNITEEWGRRAKSSREVYEKLAHREIDETVWEREWKQDFQVITQIASRVSLRLKQAQPKDLLWIKNGWTSDDPKRKGFTMLIWSHGVALPEDLVIPMLQQILHEPIQANSVFVDPVVSVRGRQFVIDWLAPFLEDDNTDYSSRSAWAMVRALSEYASSDTTNLEELEWKVKEIFLLRFLNEPPIMLARDLIHLIPLVAEDCPPKLRPMVTRVNQIASKHSDDFLRDMYKIRLNEQMKARKS